MQNNHSLSLTFHCRGVHAVKKILRFIFTFNFPNAFTCLASSSSHNISFSIPVALAVSLSRPFSMLQSFYKALFWKSRCQSTYYTYIYKLIWITKEIYFVICLRADEVFIKLRRIYLLIIGIHYAVVYFLLFHYFC